MDARLVGNRILRREGNGGIGHLAFKLGRAPLRIQACERFFEKMGLRFGSDACHYPDFYLAAGISCHLGLASNHSILIRNIRG